MTAHNVQYAIKKEANFLPNRQLPADMLELRTDRWKQASRSAGLSGASRRKFSRCNSLRKLFNFQTETILDNCSFFWKTLFTVKGDDSGAVDAESEKETSEKNVRRLNGILHSVRCAALQKVLYWELISRAMRTNTRCCSRFIYAGKGCNFILFCELFANYAQYWKVAYEHHVALRFPCNLDLRSAIASTAWLTNDKLIKWFWLN